MTQRWGDRKRARVLRAACGAVTLAAAVTSNTASAGLMVEALALPGGAYTVSADRKSVAAPIGATVTLGVYGRVSGLNTVQFTNADLDGEADAPDRRNDDSLDIVIGSFRSVGPLLGNMNSVAGNVNYNTRVTPFSSQGSQNGVAADYDSDGDLDIGPAGNDST